MKMSQNQIKELSEIYSDRMPQKVFDLMIELREHQWENGKLTDEQYNKLAELTLPQLEVILKELTLENTIRFIKLYKQKQNISFKEYWIFLKYHCTGDIVYRDTSLPSKFQARYGYPIKLFYILNRELGISYRSLESLSGIGKDTLNRYVNFYDDYLEAQKDIINAKRKLNELRNILYLKSEKL